MKIIHTADLHLGSKLDFTPDFEKVKLRRNELHETFSRMADWAEENGVGVIMLSGDVFDVERPAKSDKLRFFTVIRNHPHIDFLYLRGNHDTGISFEDDSIENLKCFTDEFTKYSYGDVDIYGAELTQENENSIYSSLNPDKEKTNIVMLHGDRTDGNGGNGKIPLRTLADKNIDYLALGHIHKYTEGPLGARGVYVYPGCPEGRGFDECGKHGFVLIETDGKITHTFKPFAKRETEEIRFDVGEYGDMHSALSAIKKLEINPESIVRLTICGNAVFDVNDLVTLASEYLRGKCFNSSVKNESRIKINVEDYKNDASIIGEFVRTVYSYSTLNDEEKAKVAQIGILALKGCDSEI